MEFVLITYPLNRQVRIDLQPQGQTNEILNVEAGFHRFDLGEPSDYVPPHDDRLVTGTSFAAPMILLFNPLAVAALPTDESLPEAEAPPARRRRTRKAAKKKARAAKKTKTAKKAKMSKKRRLAKKAAKKGRSAKKARKTPKRKASKRRSRKAR
jgi:hypothetical protein